MTTVEVNFDNLTQQEQNQLIALIEKSNKAVLRKRVKRGNKYYCISPNQRSGNCIINYYTERKNWTNNIHYNLGNYFHTRDEAEFAYHKQIILQTLKDFALKNNDREIDWNDEEQVKYEIAYNRLEDKFFIWSCGLAHSIGGVYFTSKKVTKQAIESIGKENIKKYLFGINKK